MKKRIVEMLEAGCTYKAIVDEVGCSKATISYHRTRLYGPRKKLYHHDWNEVQKFYDTGATVLSCMRKFGFARASWTKSVNAGRIVPRTQRPAAMDEVFVDSSKVHTSKLKGRLVQAGIWKDECQCCGITSWQGKPISMQVHHINGRPRDHRIENLILLCPNCHSQTDNWGAKNLKKKSLSP